MGKLLTFIHYQRYLGLSNIDYSSIFECYIINGNCFSLALQCTMLIFVLSASLGSLTKKAMVSIDMRSRAGNEFFFLVLLWMPLTHIFVNIWLRLQDESQRSLLQRLKQLAWRLKVNTLQLKIPRWLFTLWVVISVHILIITILFSPMDWKIANIGYIIAGVGLYIHIVRTNYIITYYTSLVHVLMVLLQAQANRLYEISPEELANNLCIHDQLLLLCQEEISNTFGGPFVLINLYLVLDCTSIVYIAALEHRISLMDVIYVFSWTLPLCLYINMPLVINNLRAQANKTAKILAKIPRTGTGLDRMVEKFLLKNLRQQPILTAYGFFALDKSTLFKLFTAIFTYMVILVQFKEMENSTKALEKT